MPVRKYEKSSEFLYGFTWSENEFDGYSEEDTLDLQYLKAKKTLNSYLQEFYLKTSNKTEKEFGKFIKEKLNHQKSECRYIQPRMLFLHSCLFSKVSLTAELRYEYNLLGGFKTPGGIDQFDFMTDNRPELI